MKYDIIIDKILSKIKDSEEKKMMKKDIRILLKIVKMNSSLELFNDIHSGSKLKGIEL